MNDYIISESSNIREAIKKIDKNGEGFVLVANHLGNIVGLLTDGDFRRAILSGVSLSELCMLIANKNFLFIDTSVSEREIINIFLQSKVNHLPVLENGLLIDIIFRKKLKLNGKIILPSTLEDISVVIMAGGQGTRMKPFTNIFPKPLLPVGEKSMLEIIMDEYNKYFKSNFILSVNYKANLIKSYLEECSNIYDYSFLHEDKPLGTAGALKYLKGKIDKPFFVSNCDILIKANYSSILESHISNRNKITIVSSMIHYKVPYGVCEIDKEGDLVCLTEKPEYDFLVNAGMYIIDPEVIENIPDNSFYNITDLINLTKEMGGRVGVFPVSESSYHDSGQWNEYNNMLNSIGK